jgi:hypothetical protein
MLMELGFIANEDCPEIQLEIKLDRTKISTLGFSTDLQTISYEIPNDTQEHELKILMYGKNPAIHTAVDQDNRLIRDAVCQLSYIRFDDIDVTDTFCQGRHECYRHTLNGVKEESFFDTFWGLIGCNGLVTLKFSTPIYFWLLENAGQSYDRPVIELPKY